MKKKRSVNLVALLLSMILVLAAVPSIPSVASTTTAGSNTSAKKSVVSVVSSSDTICVGEQCTLKLKNSGNWQLKKVISSNSKVAKVTTVSKSKKFATVKGVQEGKTKITFKLSYKKKVKKVSCNLTVKRLLPLKSAIGVNEAGTLALNVHTWKITKAVSANDEVASVAKVFKTHLKFVGKTAGKTTLKITAKNGNKTKTEKVSIVVKDVTQSTDQPTQQPILPSEPAVDLSVTEVTVGSQEEMQSALKRFPNLVELTIHTDLAETFKLDGNYPNLEVILDAPFAEFYNSATVKEVYIYAISCNTWHEKGLNNIINLFCECHIIVDEKALNTTINVNKNKCNSHIESNSSTVINVLSESVLTLSGSKDLATINIKSSGVIINANVVAKIINLELRTSLVINNTTDDVIQVNTPYGSFSVSKETKRTIMESGSLSSNISFGGGFGSSSSLGGGSSSSGSNSSNSGNGSAAGSDGEQTKPNPEPEQPKPDEPVVSECKHEEWTEWSNAGDDGESRECVSCHKKETRQHDLQEKISYEKIEELNESSVQTVKKHKKIFSKQCNTCIYKYSSSIEEECIFEDWQYFEKTGEDTSSCPCGHEETRQHVHSNEPSNLEFEFSKSNEDCTHEMKAKYICELCLQEIPVIKTEDCVFGDDIVSYTPPAGGSANHTRVVTKSCSVCEYSTSTSSEEECTINWRYSAETGLDVSICVCGAEQTRNHVHSEQPADLEYEFLSSNSDGTHELQAKYTCEFCLQEIPVIKTEDCVFSDVLSYTPPAGGSTNHTKVVTKSCSVCEYSTSTSSEEECTINWQYSAETGLDVSICVCGAEQTRNHIHSEQPADLEYEFLSSNSDGTHEMQATYTCEFCQAEVNVTKSEDCEFGETTIKKNPNTQWNFGHLHILSKTCNTCGYIVEEEEACVINEDIPNYYMYVSNHLALVRYCSICENDMYFLHNEHTLGEWFPRNDQEHRRECECTTVREDEDHTFGDCYDNSLGGFQCDKCGYLKVVDPHNHGYGLAGKHGDKNIMMDIVLNKDAYAECVNMSPISNPDPTSGEYCSRFDFKCRTCGAKYSCYIDHDVQNGSCKCGYAPIDVFSLIANSTSPVADEIEADALIPKKEVSVPKEVVTKKTENNVIPETVTGCAITVSGGAIKTAV